MADIATAFVKIMPSAQGIREQLGGRGRIQRKELWKGLWRIAEKGPYRRGCRQITEGLRQHRPAGRRRLRQL